MVKTEMMNRVIKKFGFEAKETIWFCLLAESKKMTDNQLHHIMISLLLGFSPKRIEKYL